MAKGNNTVDNVKRGKLTVKCPTTNCGNDMELVQVRGGVANGMYLVCPQCSNRIKHSQGIYRNYEYYSKL